MKKTLIGLLVAGALVLALTQNVEAKGNSQAGKTISVGATPVPHAELLNLIAEDIAAQGFILKVVEFTDYVQPNVAVIAGNLDANFFQHIPYLESNEEWSSKLVTAFGVHVEPFGLYSTKYTDIAGLPDNASIAIPNDPSNGGRALLLLQANGLITLKQGAGLAATIRDITGNPRGFKFQELEAAQLPRSLQDVDAAAINGNYALQAGLNPLRDSLIIEGADSPYVNIVVVQKGNELNPKVVALRNALLSSKVRDYINTKWADGSVVPVF
ncbi:MAG: MetQ/NlpA family ABC transporter substrate-binding protein [Treponema sp.]|jgi:D-methionine transport system substrate-binding protein|nr:MetQ/NlpA family ABC transporter substrate-binding protein [Treponema sp.]